MDNPTPVPSTPEIAPTVDVAQANEAIVGQPKETVTTPSKYKMKWGDTEKEVTAEEAVQLAQKAWGIEEKAKANSSKIEAAERLMHMLQNDPKAFAKQARLAGLDPNKLATEILYDNIRKNSLTPEQRELEEYKEKEAERIATEKEAAEYKKAQEVDAKTKEWSVNFEKQLEDALKTQGLPKSRLALALAAQYIDAGLKQKKDYTVTQVLPFVLRDLKQIHQETIGKLDGDELLAYVGDELANKISQARVNKFKKGGVAPAITPPASKQQAQKGPLPPEITKLKGKAYIRALGKWKSDQGIGAFFE